jgi:transposase
MEPKVSSELDALKDLSREDLIAIILEQRAMLADFKKRISELEKQLGLDGPEPPAGPVIKPNTLKGLRKKRKPRASHFARRREVSTDTVHHVPETCPDCGRRLSGGGPGRSRQVIDIEMAPVKVTEHVFHYRWCGVCRKRVRASADLSHLVSGRRRIGHRLASWIANLHINGRIPLRTVQSILKQSHGVHVSLGEMTDLLTLIAEKGEPALEAIKQEIASSECKFADETGWREDGQYRCLWAVSTALSRLFHIDPHRTTGVAMTLLGSKINGVLVTDFLYVYNRIAGRHQRCWAHFDRALDKLLLLHPNRTDLYGWVDAVKDLWKQARDYRAFCLSKPRFGAGIFDRQRKRAEFEKSLYALAEPFQEADSVMFPQATLAKRIGMFLSELFTFVEFPEVPDDNNAAERSIRPAVILRKVCGGTRSEKGSRVKAALMSHFGTWKARGKDPIQACLDLLRASP